MDAPPVRYVTTSDGYSIACCVSGEGPPFVFLPFPFNNLQIMWTAGNRNRTLFEGFASRFKFVQFDARGLGLSTRGLREDHSLDDYFLDLDAVLEMAGLDRFVLFGPPLFGYIGASYAARHPERVIALVLHNATPGPPWAGMVRQNETLARESWDRFLFTFTSAWAIHERQKAMDDYRQAITQADFMAVLRSIKGLPPIETILPRVSVPTLVVVSADVPGSLDGGRKLADLLPQSRLVSVPRYGQDLYSTGPDVPQVVLLVEEFLRTLPGFEAKTSAPSAASMDGLTRREAEILSLIASGGSNREIAESLVLSVRTVERHITNIYAKIGARGRADATAFALRNHLT